MVRRALPPIAARAIASSVLAGLVVAATLIASGCGEDAPPRAIDADARDTPEVPEVIEVGNDLDATTGPTPLPDATALPGPAVRFSHVRAAALFDAPVPALDLFGRDGHPDLSAWPREHGGFVDGLVALAEESDGASLAGAIYFAFDEALPDGALERLQGLIVDVDASSPERGRTRRTTLKYEADGGPHGAPFMVSALPVQGMPLRPTTRYLTLLLHDGDGDGFGRSQALADLLAGREGPGLPPDTDAYLAALDAAIADASIAPERIVGLTVFDTGDPVSELGAFVAAARALPPPDLSGMDLVETHERFCVFSKTIALPDYQHGDPPYANPGEGTWHRDERGAPALARTSDSRVFVTVPRLPAPAVGYPLVVFIRTGGGGDRPLVDRGPRAQAHGEPIVPTGTGPAMNLAAAGWAAITWDGPHGGLRNVTGGDEQFLMFNVTNPAGTRDNIRQTALEAILLGDLAAGLTIDASACVGATAGARFDPDQVAIMGHSMGGWIAPIAMSHSGKFESAILSGAGGSWIANVVYKQSPLEVRPIAEQLLGYQRIDRTLDVHDPALTLLQWAGEAADPQVYGVLAMTPPRNVLMIEGIVDTYILPPIANTTALSLGLDLAGAALDASDPRLVEYTPLVALLPEAGAEQRALPTTGNREGRTAVVVQAPGDDIEDGHEAMFQTPGPKHQYRCFLESLAASGVPTVVVAGAEWDACP